MAVMDRLISRRQSHLKWQAFDALFAIEQIVNGLRRGFERSEFPEDTNHAPPNAVVISKVERP